MKCAKLILCSVLAIICMGCSNRKNLSPIPSISDDARAELSRPVNCATAQRDIKTLESERASVAKQILSGVRSVMPIAAVAGILMGDYSDRAEVATGQYNNDIEKKINIIQNQCNIAKVG